LCNIIEHIFGVLKHKWRILLLPPEYTMDIQARIPTALCALHNFIRQFNPEDFYDPELGGINLLNEEDDVGQGVIGNGPADPVERRRADTCRDAIAREMWIDYQEELRNRGIV
jgi:hypothetical protein